MQAYPAVTVIHTLPLTAQEKVKEDCALLAPLGNQLWVLPMFNLK